MSQYGHCSALHGLLIREVSFCRWKQFGKLIHIHTIMTLVRGKFIPG